MSVRRAIETFVEVYNRPGSDVYPLFGDEVDWIEMPSGRRGGPAPLVAPLEDVRLAVEGLPLEVISLVAGGPGGGLAPTPWPGPSANMRGRRATSGPPPQAEVGDRTTPPRVAPAVLRASRAPARPYSICGRTRSGGRSPSIHTLMLTITFSPM